MAGRITIFENVCKGCGLCTLVCPKKIMTIDRSRFNGKGYNPSTVTDMSQCIACAMCATMCPDSAIMVEEE
ncbi:MAG: 4Fe-4S binding protein [Synergistaceae bacterium]|nr:4Fe-4S binding protein [Synergistaceae bacterium]